MGPVGDMPTYSYYPIGASQMTSNEDFLHLMLFQVPLPLKLTFQPKY